MSTSSEPNATTSSPGAAWNGPASVLSPTRDSTVTTITPPGRAASAIAGYNADRGIAGTRRASTGRRTSAGSPVVEIDDSGVDQMRQPRLAGRVVAARRSPPVTRRGQRRGTHGGPPRSTARRCHRRCRGTRSHRLPARPRRTRRAPWGHSAFRRCDRRTGRSIDLRPRARTDARQVCSPDADRFGCCSSRTSRCGRPPGRPRGSTSPA